MDIQFQAGVFKKFRVVHKIHLGQFSLDLPEGTLLDFDGMTLMYGGQTYSVPAAVGAVRAGWMVPVEDVTTTTYAHKAAGIEVRAATAQGSDRGKAFKITAVMEDEQIVGSTQASEAKREEARKTAAAENQVFSRPTAPKSIEPTPQEPPAPFDSAFKMASVPKIRPLAKGTPLQEEDDEQGGVPVARIGGALKTSFEFKDAHDAAEALRRMETSGRVAPVEKIAAKPLHVNAEAEAGVAITSTFPGGATGDVAEAYGGTELEELLPGVTSSGRPTPCISSPPADFQWDKSGHWRDRVKRAMAHKDNPVIIDSICAVEVKTVVDHLRAELRKRNK